MLLYCYNSQLFVQIMLTSFFLQLLTFSAFYCIIYIVILNSKEGRKSKFKYLDKMFMNENKEVLNIHKEDLENMTLEDLVDLQFELDDMLHEVKELIAECDEMLKEEV